MKKLFAVLLAVAMLLSLGVTAFAKSETTGDITVANHPDKVAYMAYKVFDVVKNADGTLTYYIDPASPWAPALWKTSDPDDSTVSVVTPKSLIPGLTFVPAELAYAQIPVDADGDDVQDVDGEGNPVFEDGAVNAVNSYTGDKDHFTGAGKVYKVVKDVDFSAADFAATLKAALYPTEDPETHDPVAAIVSEASLNGTESESVWVNKGTEDAPAWYPIDPAQDVVIKNLVPGYYMVVGADTTAANRDFALPDDPEDLSAGSLTTVLANETVQVQNKSDMPLDKTVDDADTDKVYDDDNTGVNLGDTLNYKIETKAPVLGEENTSYIFQLSDTMSEGLTFNNVLKITATPYTTGESSAKTYTLTYVPVNPDKNIYEAQLIQSDGTNTVNIWQLVTDPKASLTGNQVRFNENGKTFEISFDVSSKEAGSFRGGNDITIEYSAVVNENSVVEVLENKVVLSYGNDKDSLINKDDSTKNYLSQILIDKFAEGNNTQKLAGAEFKLYKLEDAVNTAEDGQPDNSIDQYGNKKQVRKFYQLAVVNTAAPDTAVYKFTEVSFANGQLVVPDGLKAKNGNGEPWDDTTNDLKDGYIYKLLWVDAEADGTKVVTNTDGAAAFGYLPDGTYYLLETKAPVDYTKLLEAIKIVVDGKAATEPSMTDEQQDLILTNIANVANTPGSTLPSTGGVGATLLTIGGIALMLAAGAFLILRRKEQE